MAFYKSTSDEIEKLIQDHVEECRQNIPWSGENTVVVEKIIKIFKRTTWKKVKIIADFTWRV